MNVLCQRRTRADVRLDECREYAQDTADELKLGATYTVYAQCLHRACFWYLIEPDGLRETPRPGWYPAEWFSVLDGRISPTWIFAYAENFGGLGPQAMWGYPELVASYEHWSGLLDRKDEALSLWSTRKSQIDSLDDSSSR